MPPVRETRLVVIFGCVFIGCLTISLDKRPITGAACFGLAAMLTVTALTSDD